MGKVFDVIKDRDKDTPLDIHDYMVTHPASTFFMKMEGDGPKYSGIEDGDVLVIDRAVTAKEGNLAVLIEDGILKVEKLSKNNQAEELVLWGTVVGLLRKF